MTPVDRYLTRHGIRARDLIYLSREDGQTVVHLSDGRRLTTYRTVKEFAAALPHDHFLSVNKGILVRRDAIASESDGILVLIDGTRLARRRQQRSVPLAETKEDYCKRLACRYAILDDHPVAHLLYSLPLFDTEEGAILRYHNRAAEPYLSNLSCIPHEAIVAVLQGAAPPALHSCCLYSPEDEYCLLILDGKNL